jgi:hypothetical protein
MCLIVLTLQQVAPRCFMNTLVDATRTASVDSLRDNVAVNETKTCRLTCSREC